MPRGIFPRKPRPPTPIDPRFWAKVDKTGDCWIWTAAAAKRRNATYGHIWDSTIRKVDRAHRVSWRLAYGPIPPGMQVLHRCDTPLCVRPDHLFLGTQIDNIADMDRKGRRRNLFGDDHPARRPGARIGERNGRALLSATDIPAIRTLYAHGLLCREIAAFYGVKYATIYGVISRKNWSHIP